MNTTLEKIEEKLKFSPGKSNSKLQKLGGVVYTFSLPSGWSCPAAQDCLSKVIHKDGKFSIQDGKKTKFRCFSATQEVVYKGVREQRQYNFTLLRQAHTPDKMAHLIKTSIPEEATIVRVHVGGDFYNRDYMFAWFVAARCHPKKTFYAYTKSLNYWVEYLNIIPPNFKLNASKGGRYDDLIPKHKLKYAEVVFTEKEALDKGLEIDHDDTHAFLQEKPFALLLHGVQPKGSLASEALKNLKGVGSYGKGKRPTEARWLPKRKIG